MPLDPAALAIIEEHCRGQVLELGTGSGAGTRAARVNADHVTTVENLSPFARAAKHEFADDPKVTALQYGLTNKTYRLPPDLGMLDTIIVDGPRGRGSRGATLEKVGSMLAPGGKIIVDDLIRDREVIEKWAAYYNLNVEEFDTAKGLAILTHA